MYIFDLDGTVICSKHRTKNAIVNGRFCVPTYIKNCNTPELINKDTLLPLASFMQLLASQGTGFAIITARYCTDADREFLKAQGLINSNTILMGRDSVHSSVRALSDADYKRHQINRLKRSTAADTYTMFEDMPEVISAMQSEGITCLDAVELNLSLRDLNPLQVIDQVVVKTGSFDFLHSHIQYGV